MSRFQSWILLVFLINIYFIVGTKEADRPGNRAWLDLNFHPYEVPNMDLNFVPEDLSEPPAEIIPNDQNPGTSAQIPEGSSSSSYDKDRQLMMENLFLGSGQNWNELRSDPDIRNKKWKIMCVEMIIEWKKRKGPMSTISCEPSPYIISGETRSWRRIKFKEKTFKKMKGNRPSDAPNLLLCHCTYAQAGTKITANTNKYFAVRHYQKNEYFLLARKPDKSHSIYMVHDIYPR